MKVDTTEGPVECAELEVRDIVHWSDNARVLATEWTRQGRLVRRDVAVSVLRTAEVGVQHGQ